MPRIAVDAMGSDAAPRVELEGVLAAVRAQRREGHPRRRRAAAARRAGRAGRERQEGSDRRSATRPTSSPCTIAPSMAVKQKKQSSMRVCFDLVKAGEADAVVSAGNSGAMMACGLFVLGRLPGVERPAIVTTFPTKAGECALLDMGANVDPKPSVLAQFAVLGLGLRAPAARQGAAAGRPAVERLRGSQGDAADARRAPAADAARSRRRRRLQLRRLRRGARHLPGPGRRGRHRRVHRQRRAQERRRRRGGDPGHGARRGRAVRAPVEAGRRADDRRAASGCAGAPTTRSTAARRCWASTASR